MKTCTQCQSSFEVTDADRAFYKTVKVPEPTHCPQCRLQRRLAFRNERYLFKRTCNLCQKSMISFFDDQVPFPVYCTTCWWSDEWDPLSYGRDFDFNRPFFEQFQELLNVVPKAGMLQINSENSDYNSFIAFSKNTYMSPGSYFAEDCYYVRKSQYVKNCLDCDTIDHSELLRACINCKHCYASHHLVNCQNCSHCAYVADSIGCQNCFMCAGLSNKKFHYKNQPYSKEEYEKIVAAEMQKNPNQLLQEFKAFSASIPKKYQDQINCQNSSGDHIQNCKNATQCYDCFDVEDSKYLLECVNVKDSMDLAMHDKEIERCYELCSGGERNQNLKFAFCTIASPHSEYLYSCFYLSDSFGCDSINKRQSHCILNKKYSEEEYGDLKHKIKEHMWKTREYGEFFPIALSLHPYNATMAHDYFPLTQAEALTKGFKYRKKNPRHYQPTTTKISSDIKSTPDSIVDEILACISCGKNYRIIAHELQLCRQLNIPLSSYCPDCRLQQLSTFKNLPTLYDRKCDKCQSTIRTTYSPDRPERVYCESCYLNEVY